MSFQPSKRGTPIQSTSINLQIVESCNINEDTEPPTETERQESDVFQLRSCFKGERVKKKPQVHAKLKSCKVDFKSVLDNNKSLDSSIRERIEHNLKYNDDTIFDNLEIF